MILVLLNHTKIKFHSGKQCTQTMHFRADADGESKNELKQKLQFLENDLIFHYRLAVIISVAVLACIVSVGMCPTVVGYGENHQETQHKC